MTRVLDKSGNSPSLDAIFPADRRQQRLLDTTGETTIAGDEFDLNKIQSLAAGRQYHISYAIAWNTGDTVLLQTRAQPTHTWVTVASATTADAVGDALVQRYVRGNRTVDGAVGESYVDIEVV